MLPHAKQAEELNARAEQREFLDVWGQGEAGSSV